jgi:hypothetical protein
VKIRSEVVRSGGKDTREREREIGTRIELLFTGVGATNFDHTSLVFLPPS